MKAMIFAAGKGTRLHPLTDTMPKALVPVGGIPLLERVIRKLIEAGCNEIIVNIHHFAGQIIAFLEEKQRFNIHIEVSDETDNLLDTGGGLVKASRFFDDNRPFIVHNVDIISSIDLKNLYACHTGSGAAATLAVSSRKSSRYLLFDDNDRLQGWINESTGEQKPAGKELQISTLNKLAFSGIQVINPLLLPELRKQNGKFSIIDFYLRHMEQYRIEGVSQANETTIDVGKIDTFREADSFIRKAKL